MLRMTINRQGDFCGTAIIHYVPSGAKSHDSGEPESPAVFDFRALLNYTECTPANKSTPWQTSVKIPLHQLSGFPYRQQARFMVKLRNCSASYKWDTDCFDCFD